MITDKEFLVFINDKSLDGSLEENLNRIIDEEMEKPEEEMDTALIEYCLDKLNKLESETPDTEEKKGNGDSNGKRINFKFKKAIAIAAAVAVAVFLVGTLSVSAFVFDVNLFDGIVEIYNDYIRINIDKTNDKVDSYQLLGTELAKELADNGFEKVLLPDEIFSANYEITNIEYETGEFINSTNITFESRNGLGSIHISQYSMEEIVPDVEFLNVTSNIEKLEIGNTAVYCFMQDDTTAITYRDGLSIYFIQIPLNLDEAIGFAKTIK